MPSKPQPARPTPNEIALRAELVRALRDAVRAEVRYGAREDCQQTLEDRWLAVVSLIRG